MSLLRIRVIRTIDGFTFAAIANAKAIVFLVDASLKINGFTLLNTRPICTPGGLGFSVVPATLVVSDNRDEVNDRLGLELELRDNVTDGLLLGDSVPEDVCESVDENEGDDVELSDIVGLVDIDKEIVGLFEFEIVGLFDDVCDGEIELVEDGVDDGLLIPIHTSFAVSPLTPPIVATTLRFALTVLGK